MPRSVNSVASRARRKKIIKLAKGYFGRRKNVWTVAKDAVEKAMLYAYRDRKTKKRNFRSLWIARINAGSRDIGVSYSVFINSLSKKEIKAAIGRSPDYADSLMMRMRYMFASGKKVLAWG